MQIDIGILIGIFQGKIYAYIFFKPYTKAFSEDECVHACSVMSNSATL